MRPRNPERREAKVSRKSSLPLGLLGAGLAAVTLGWLVGPWNSADRPAGRPPRNLLLITIDTLRADALGAYGSAGAATPWLDRLAAAGVRFDDARAHNVVTLPSHANILTGRLPTDHGVRDNAGFRLPANEDTLATRLAARGFRTAAFISAFPLDSRFGLARGFDVYDDRFVDAMARPGMLEQERAAQLTVAAARAWLQAQDGSRPWFAWVHVYEPHYPYAAPEPFASRFASDPYAGEVAAVDAALQPLLQPILDQGSNAETMVVVTSDHGEALGDHEEATHGIFAYEATLRVPLLLYYPPLLEPRVDRSAARHIDIAPTVLDALDHETPAPLTGRSLLDAAGRSDDVVYFEALSGLLNRGWAPLTGVVRHGLKYIDLPIPELYDLSADPAERRNLAAERAAQVEDLRRALATYGRGQIRRTDETPEVRERLRSLGYASGATPRSAKTFGAADDPKRLIRFDVRLQQVVDAYLSGRMGEALEQCRALVAEQPEMRIALLQLGYLEREAGNLPAAIEVLRRAVQLSPGDLEAASLLGASLTAANRPLEAIAVLEPLARAPDADVQVIEALAISQARAGRTDAALSTLGAGRRQDAANARLMIAEGTVQMMAGRRRDARAAFQAALDANPDSARAHSSMAALAAEEGQVEDALGHWRHAVRLDPAEHERLLAIGLAIARAGRAVEARPYIQLFADSAPRSRYAADVARAREWLARPTGR